MSAAMKIALMAVRAMVDDPLVLEIVEEALGGRSQADPSPERPRGLSSTERSRARREKLKALHATPDATDATLHATGNATANATPVAPPDPPRETLSLSYFSQKSHKEERESQTRVRPATLHATGNATANATPVAVASDAQRYVNVGDAITDELRAIAEGATGARPVRDVASAWLKFTGHYAGQWVHVAGKWQQWCVREGSREQSGPPNPPVDQEARRRARKVDEAAADRAHAAQLLRGSRGPSEPRKVGGG